MDSIQLKDLAIKHFSQFNVTAAIIGSKSNNDLDMFILNNNESTVDVGETINFLDRLHVFHSETSCEFKAKHEHRNWLKKEKQIIHLLFYPTLSHLLCWELPSYIACVYQRGEFFLGDKSILRRIYEDYRLRHYEPKFDILTYQLLTYMDVTVTNLVYLSTNSDIYNMKGYWENLQYVYRYTLRELLVSELKIDEDIVFWEKKELIQYIVEFFPKFKSIGYLLNNDISRFEGITKNKIKTLFIEHLKLCKRKLSGFDISIINQIIGEFSF